MRLAIGGDHCGFEMKQRFLPILEKDHTVTDFGCYSKDPADFPDIAKKICSAILAGEADRGIMFCSTGIGAAIACNKVKGIRAGVCHDTYSAHQGVEHDNIQVLAIGAEIIGFHAIDEIIKTFLAAEFSQGEEFARRLQKLEVMEEEGI